MRAGGPPLLALAAILALLAGGCTPDRDLSTADLYDKYCARCHGGDGRGAKGYLKPGADLLASEMVLAGREELVRRRIANGKGPMPGFARRLDPADLERLVAFVFELSGSGATMSRDDPTASDLDSDLDSGPKE